MPSRRRPSAALVVAFVALMLALSAPAWGATAKSAIIKGRQIASNAITSSKVKDGSLLAKDFKKGQLPKGDTGAKGDAGAKGATGDKGATGATGAKGDQGVPGPTVAGGAKSDSGTIGPVGGATALVDLATGATTTGQVVLPWAGVIMANGFADVDNAAAAAARIRCNLFISNGTGPNNGLTAFSPNAFGDTTAVVNEHRAIPLTGFVTKPAGTYNIAVRCENVTNTMVAYSAAVNYTAVPAS